MAEYDYFWDFELVNGDPDREYSSLSWEKIFKRLIDRSGYIDNFPENGKPFLVEPDTGMNIRVGPGAAWIEGKYYENDGQLVLPVQNSDTFTRVDAVVLRRDNGNRRISLAVKKGSQPASGQPATAPAMQVDASIHEVLIWDFEVPAGSLSITSGNVSGRSRLSAFGLAQGPRVTSQLLPVSETERDAISPKYAGLAVYNETRQRGEVYTGTAWQPFGVPEPKIKVIKRGSDITFNDNNPHYLMSTGIGVASDYAGRTVQVDVMHNLGLRADGAGSDSFSFIYHNVEVSFNGGATWEPTFGGAMPYSIISVHHGTAVRNGLFTGTATGQIQMRSVVGRYHGQRYYVLAASQLTGRATIL